MAEPLVSSVVVHTEGAHEAVNVWLRGAHVGKLLVGKGDGAPLRNLLLLESKAGQEIIGERAPTQGPWLPGESEADRWKGCLPWPGRPPARVRRGR